MGKLYKITFDVIYGHSQSRQTGQFIVESELLDALKLLNNDKTCYLNIRQEKVVKELFNVDASYYHSRITTNNNNNDQRVYTLSDFNESNEKVEKELLRESKLRTQFYKERGINPNEVNPFASIILELEFCIWRVVHDISESLREDESIMMTENIEYKG